MSNPLLLQLTQATVSTFEDLGFVLPAPDVDEEQAAVPLAWSARVAFRGPVAGAVVIRATDGVVVELAANMLGIENEVQPAVKQDALGEIANVICGNVVPALGTARDIFDLAAPELAALDSAETKPGGAGTVRLVLGVDEGRVEVDLVLEAGVGEGSAA